MSTIWRHRCLITPDAYVALARGLAAGLAGASAQGMWSVPLSPTGEAPATHWISVGLMDEDFANLLPLTTFDEEGEPTTQPGQPGLIVELAAAQGQTVPLAAVEAMLAACQITLDDGQAGIARAGLVMVQPEEPEVPDAV